MPNGTMTFTADVNKTVTIEGEVYTLTPSNVPDNVTLYLNEVQLQNGVPVELSQDMALTVTVQMPDPVTISQTGTTGVTTKLDGVAWDGAEKTLAPGAHTIESTAPTSIPKVTVSGTSVQKIQVNGTEYDTLPHSFIPIEGIENSIVITGTGDVVPNLHITGTNIGEMTVNGTAVELPYQVGVTGDLEIGVGGKVYALDVTGVGAALTVDGAPMEDGNTEYHKIINVDHNIFVNANGTHTLTVSGQDITAIAVNGVSYSVDNLPITILNQKMTATVDVAGNVPSEVHISGLFIDTVTLDGKSIPVGANGSVDLEIETSQENHFVNITGSQPRRIPITINNGGSTSISINGESLPNGTYYFTDGVYIAASPTPIPINVENPTSIIIDVNGVRYPATDFTFNVTGPTEIDVRSNMCKCTIDYGDNSYTVWVPQQMVTFTAPHRNGWVFDTWSSVNCGIESPKMVRTQIDLTGKSEVNLVAHYQRYVTCDKPNPWN